MTKPLAGYDERRAVLIDRARRRGSDYPAQDALNALSIEEYPDDWPLLVSAIGAAAFTNAARLIDRRNQALAQRLGIFIAQKDIEGTQEAERFKGRVDVVPPAQRLDQLFELLGTDTMDGSRLDELHRYYSFYDDERSKFIRASVSLAYESDEVPRIDVERLLMDYFHGVSLTDHMQVASNYYDQLKSSLHDFCDALQFVKQAFDVTDLCDIVGIQVMQRTARNLTRRTVERKPYWRRSQEREPTEPA